MKRRYTATRVKPQRNHLTVYVTLEVGTTVRFAAITLPYAMMADHHQDIVEGLERVYVAQLEADADVQYLPLEKWE